MDDNDFEVGYGKPPKEYRFTRGQSGNPNGRPKGTLNVATVVDRIMRERVVVNENGKRTSITKLEASVKQLLNKSASGDMRALQFAIGLIRYSEASLETVRQRDNRPMEDLTDEELIEIIKNGSR
jgi:hypothetical protein